MHYTSLSVATGNSEGKYCAIEWWVGGPLNNMKKVSSTIPSKGLDSLDTNHVEAFMIRGDKGHQILARLTLYICRRTITGVGYMWAVSPLIKLMTGLTFLDKLHPDYLHRNGYSDTTWPHTALLFMLFVLVCVINFHHYNFSF